jgi:Tfp pilus assembly protein PilF
MLYMWKSSGALAVLLTQLAWGNIPQDPNTLFKQGHFEEALTLLRHTADKPMATSAPQIAGEVFLLKNQLSKATQNLERAHAAQPGDLATNRLLVEAYYRSKKIRRADRFYTSLETMAGPKLSRR